jgi:hypothetical protein
VSFFDDILANDASFMCAGAFSESVLYTRADGSENTFNMIVDRDQPGSVQDAAKGNAVIIVASLAVADFLAVWPNADPDTGGDYITTHWRQNGAVGDFRLLEIRTTDPGMYTLIFSGKAPVAN